MDWDGDTYQALVHEILSTDDGIQWPVLPRQGDDGIRILSAGYDGYNSGYGRVSPDRRPGRIEGVQNNSNKMKTSLPFEFKTLRELFLRSTSRYADLPFCQFADKSEQLSYLNFADRVNNLSALLCEHGVGYGDKVAILSENMPNWSVAFFCCCLVQQGGCSVTLRSQRERGEDVPGAFRNERLIRVAEAIAESLQRMG